MRSSKSQFTENCFGYCQDCNSVHSLEAGNTRDYCLDLMEELEAKRNIDFSIKADPIYSTDYLWGEARGQMFGVLECVNSKGEKQILKAFSGQYNSQWNAPNWVPPILDLNQYESKVPKVEKEIKSLGKEIANTNRTETERRELLKKRKSLSQKLMIEIHNMYTLQNFGGERKKLREVFYEKRGIPTGTADCCAPKLLHYAALNQLKPIGISEFYWGKENRSQTKKHKEFYNCCKNKCQAILGYLLCGL